MHLHTGLLTHHPGQQFLRPGGTRIAVILRTLIHQVIQHRQITLVDLERPIVGAGVVQTRRAKLAKAGDDAVDPRHRAADRLGDPRACALLVGQQHDLTTHGQRLVARLSTHPANLKLDAAIEAKEHLAQRRLLS
jgi:hypothetical protein